MNALSIDYWGHLFYHGSMTNLPEEEIQVWETEEPMLIVWGTHDVALATKLSVSYYNDFVGIEYIPEGIETMLNKAMKRWVDPSVEDIDDDVPWPDEKISKEYVEGWIPMLSYAY